MTTTNMFLNFGGKWDSPPLVWYIYVYLHHDKPTLQQNKGKISVHNDSC